jgi:gliding motility-associated-like protein
VGNGIISYVAPAGFAGTAIIGYQVCDDAAVVVCDPSEIVVTIVPNTLTVSEVVENASCFGRNDASIALTATGGLGPITFSWSTGDNTADVSELTAGDYSVVVTDAGGCAAAQTLNYTVTSPAEIVLNLNLDFDPCIDKTANIDLTVTGGVPAYIYIWADGAVSTEDRVGVEPGKTYSVTVGDAQGCTVTGEIAIDDSQADCFRVPDGFSPDGDGTNDNLVIRGIGKYPGNIVKIFNRWGNLVYEATNYDNSWNGVANTGGVVVGERVQPGTYFYVIDLNNDDEPVSGYIIIKY